MSFLGDGGIDDPVDDGVEYELYEEYDSSDAEWQQHQEEIRKRLKERRKWEAELPKLARDEARAEAREERAARED